MSSRARQDRTASLSVTELAQRCAQRAHTELRLAQLAQHLGREAAASLFAHFASDQPSEAGQDVRFQPPPPPDPARPQKARRNAARPAPGGIDREDAGQPPGTETSP